MPQAQLTPSDHHSASIPPALFTDPVAETRWRARFAAIRMGLPDQARDAADHTVLVSNMSGAYELYCWQPSTDTLTQSTSRQDGTTQGTLSPDGANLWWFDDSAGDEFGSWRIQPFGSAPGEGFVAPLALPEVGAGYPAGLEVGASVTIAGFSDDEGTRIHLCVDGSPSTVVYSHAEDAGVGALSRDETIWVLSHSEHGDSRYPALRALSVRSGAMLAELSDAPGKGLNPLAFSPVAGDQRLLVGHERQGREELLIWDLETGAVTELRIDLPGDIDGDFYPDATALLLIHTHAARTSMHRWDLTTGELTNLPGAPGVVSGATVRAGGALWYRHSSAETAATVRILDTDGDRVLLRPPGEPAPASQPVADVWVDGPGGRIHALMARPAPGGVANGVEANGGALPTVFFVHGGPAAADEDDYDATRAAWLDAGFATVQVNYRGSTGYGSQWRDALTQRMGHTELADIAAVYDHLLVQGLADADACVIAGYSWGGYLALLAAGTQPSRWAAVVAGVPVADYVAAYEDEMEPLRAYDRALFGGSPAQVPDKYADSSPITYVDAVRAPVLVLAGENDPRCPIRQIDNYLGKLAELGSPYEVYRYEAGHGSMVVQERLRQVLVEIDFVRRALAHGVGA
ncbi:S9 family peptidase [Nakamurella antarctica]|uniref:S9 family peptidase n=1 Tax=Nakamurella antarctica TaxID=1902245 RepID=A0A3G8ZR96_9ACTN|nr:S9 family peptidase [Nakamurella antarctica]